MTESKLAQDRVNPNFEIARQHTEQCFADELTTPSAQHRDINLTPL